MPRKSRGSLASEATVEGDADTTARSNAPSTTPACTHHWLIGDHTEGKADGRCKKCGAVRTFTATSPRSEWELQAEGIRPLMSPRYDRRLAEETV